LTYISKLKFVLKSSMVKIFTNLCCHNFGLSYWWGSCFYKRRL